MEQLLEKTKNDILDSSKKASKYVGHYVPGNPDSGQYVKNNQHLGKSRWDRRKHSSISTSTRDYSEINMNTFFKKDVLSFKIPVRGETDNYKVDIKIVGLLEELQNILDRDQKGLEWKHIAQALANVANKKDIYVHCQCKDWKYRFQYWSRHTGSSNIKDHSLDKELSGFSSIDTKGLDSTMKPTKNISNPLNNKGDGCKHVLLVLANMSWKRNLASSILNYVKRLQERQERLYQTIVFPALYGEPYSDEIQQQLFNPDTGRQARNYLPTSRKELQQANKDAAEKGRFKKGNKQGIRFAKNDEESEEDQVQLDIDLEDEEEVT